MILERMVAGISDVVQELPLYINGYKASGERNTLAERIFMWWEVWSCGLMFLVLVGNEPLRFRLAFWVYLPFLALAGIHALYVQWKLNRHPTSLT